MINVTLNNVLGLNETIGTFCVETKEFINPGSTYNADVSTAAIKGGEATSDPLDPKTAWLFWQYWTGAITLNSNAEAAGFQWAIWDLEDEDTTGLSISSPAQTYYTGYLAQANASTWIDTGPVRVLNLGDSPTYAAQDLLIPEPATLLILGLGGLLCKRIKLKRT